MGRPLACCSIALALMSSVAVAATLTGRAVDEDGQPVTGANVWLCFDHIEAGARPMDVVAATTTGDDGAFSIADPDHEAPLGEREHWWIYAYKPGLALTRVEAVGPAQTHELKLVEPAIIKGRIFGEGAQPLAGAAVRLSRASSGTRGAREYQSIYLPQEISEACSVKTDATGAFELSLMPLGWEVSVTVSASGYAAWTFSSDTNLAELHLVPAGSLKGRVVCEERPEIAAGVHLRASGRLRGGSATNSVETETDERGEFAFPELPPGSYGLFIREQPTATHHVLGRANIAVKPKEETGVELTAQKTAPVTGRVIAADTGEGLPRVTVSVSRYSGGVSYASRTETNAEGRFEVPSIRGPMGLDAWLEGYIGPRYENRVQVTVGPEGATVPDIKLVRASPVIFVVVDDAGDPVPGAAVFVYGTGTVHNQGKTDEQGVLRMRLEPEPKEIWAQTQELALEQTVSLDLQQHEAPVRLVLKPGVLATATVTVVDGAGNPVTDAKAKLDERREKWGRSIPCDGPDAQGVIRVSGLRPGAAYQFAIEAPGCDPAKTDEWQSEPGATHDFGVITLKRQAGLLAGTVVDEAGQPVAGATVFNSGDAPQKVVTITDQQGAFRLEGLHEGKACAFVDSPDHQFAASIAETGTTDLRIVLRPKQPASLTKPEPLERPIPEAEARELAKGLLLDTLRETRDDNRRRREGLLTLLAELDPEAAFEEAAQAGDPTGSIALAVGSKRLAEDFGEAVSLIIQHEQPYRPVWELYRAALEFMDDRPELALQCIEEALAMASGITNPGTSVSMRARLGNALLRFDEQRAVELLAEAQNEAAALGVTDTQVYYRGVVAEQICERDLEAALELIGAIEKPSDRNRHFINVARRVAKTNPDRALEILDRLSSDYARQGGMASIVAFFPGDQLDRAVKLAQEQGDSFFRSLALARLASVAPAEQVPALLDEAITCHVVRSGGASVWRSAYDRAKAAARIACVARRLGYTAHRRFALRAASLCGPDPDESWRRRNASGEAFEQLEVAGILAFTDPAVARHIADSVLRRLGGVEAFDPRGYARLAAAAAQVDPRWALELLEQMKPDDPKEGQGYQSSAVRAIAKRLLESPEEIEYELLTNDYQYDWLPIDEDW